ncbi:MAG TPA: nucleotide exchange factor GrpE [Solirubrobacteraceae bacterium]|jgi:molecular chaperone GrpE|nr:nucleotide exchange factor GrpE [Solirubrobacteraceae bacterium]
MSGDPFKAAPKGAAPPTPGDGADAGGRPEGEPTLEEAPEAEVQGSVEGDAEPEAEVDPVAARAAKADEYLALAQRTQADFENYRKRAVRDAALAQARGVAKLAKELLPAVDNLDRALAAARAAAAAAGEGDEVHAQLVSGIELVHADVISALQRAGIEGFSPVGETFDPQLHEAVAQAPIAGAEPGSVVEVYQRGYKLGESVLRPARVLVAA